MTTTKPTATDMPAPASHSSGANSDNATTAHQAFFIIAAAATGIAASLAAVVLHINPATLLAWLVVPVAVSAAIIDARSGKIPNALTAPLGAGVAAYLLTSTFESWELLTAALIGASASAILHGLLWLTGAYGGGDLKLSITLTSVAATLGLLPAAIAIGAPSLLLLPVVLAQRWIMRRKSSRSRFGPYLAAGFLLALVTAYFTSLLPL